MPEILKWLLIILAVVFLIAIIGLAIGQIAAIWRSSPSSGVASSGYAIPPFRLVYGTSSPSSADTPSSSAGTQAGGSRVTASDNGRTLVYPRGARFSTIGGAPVSLSCERPGVVVVLSSSSNGSMFLEAREQGTCRLKIGSAEVTIRVAS